MAEEIRSMAISRIWSIESRFKIFLVGFGVVLLLIAACDSDAPTPMSTLVIQADATVMEGLVYRTLDADWTRTPEVELLVAGAQTEGSVHITTYNQEQVDVWCTAFTAEFGIACEGRGMFGAQMMATLITERQAGAAVTDVIHLSMSQAAEVLDRGYIAEINWASLGVDAGRVWKSRGPGTAVGATQSQYTHFYNTDHFTVDQLPQKLEDWLKPEYKGKICAPDFLFRAGSGFIALSMGMDATVDLARRLIDEQDMVVTVTCDPLIVSGEKPLMFLGYGNPPALLDGNPIAQFWTGGLGVNLFSNMVASNASHPNAARLFAAWATSRDASSLSYVAIGQGWAAYGHGPEALVSGRFAVLDLVYESPLNFSARSESTRVFQERMLEGQ